jgi:hypothetical protein
LGALNHAIVVDQFTRLRDGDSWWYENPGVLDAPTLNQIKATTWVRADVISVVQNVSRKGVQQGLFSIFACLNPLGTRGRGGGGNGEGEVRDCDSSLAAHVVSASRSWCSYLSPVGL